MEPRQWPDEWYDVPAEPEPEPKPRKPRTRSKLKRFDFAPFEEHIRLNYADTHIRRRQQVGEDQVAAGHIGELVEVSAKVIFQYRRRGVSYHQADRIACKLDIHPSLIWSDWWDEEVNEEDD